MTSPRDVLPDLPTMRVVPAMARRLFVCALVALVSGCATTSGLERTMQGGSTIEGRMSVRYRDQSTGKEDASQGNFVWTSSGDELELSLLSQIGQAIALIRSDARHSSIVFRDGRKVEGDSPEVLTERTLGWTVPLRGLRYWLDGRTDPASAVTTLDDGRVRQDRWTIRFVREDGAPADAKPKRIDLAYPGPPAEIELRLVIDQRSAP
jgi:outer membrane lipoprotein LolB